MILHQYITSHGESHEAALAFSAILAADKGVSSQVELTEAGWLVTADDGRAVLFSENSAPSSAPART